MGIDAIGSCVQFPVNQTSSVKTASTDMKACKSNRDKVSISPEALRVNLLTSFMDGAGNDGVITLDEMRAFRDKKIGLVQSILGDTLNDLNIQSYGRLQIDIDHKNNTAIVSGDTDENNSAIAEALQENDQFRTAWNTASGTSTVIAAVEASKPFRDAYSSDPKAAVAQYSWLFDKDWDFNMYFEGSEIDYSVT